MTDDISNDEWEENIRQLREQQHGENFGRIGYDSGDKFLTDEVNFTSDIIKDEVYNHVQPHFNELMLKKSTLAYLDRLMRATTTQEIVINNYTSNDIMSEKIGVKKNTVYAMTNVSALEKKYCDIDSMLIYNNVHHRTKVTRGRMGFERGAQKTSIIKSHAYNINEKPEEQKTGISRYVQSRRF